MNYIDEWEARHNAVESADPKNCSVEINGSIQSQAERDEAIRTAAARLWVGVAYESEPQPQEGSGWAYVGVTDTGVNYARHRAQWTDRAAREYARLVREWADPLAGPGSIIDGSVAPSPSAELTHVVNWGHHPLPAKEQSDE